MPSKIDVNEYLFLKTLSSVLEKESSRSVRLEHYYSLLKMDEHFFKITLQSMQKKRLVEIGFLRRGIILKVVNWTEKFCVSTSKMENFSISMTKMGKLQLESW